VEIGGKNRKERERGIRRRGRIKEKNKRERLPCSRVEERRERIEDRD
jgi:hypothetical protein